MNLGWLLAGQKYLHALAQHNWSGTYVGAIAGHPGITVLSVSALLYWLHQFIPAIDVVFFHRAVFIILQAVLMTISLKLLRKWFSKYILFLTSIYWIFQPQILRALNISWLDQILTWLFTIIVLLWLRYVHEHRRWQFCAVGVLLGFALLTKVAAALIAMILVVLSWQAIPKLRTRAKLLVGILVISALTFFLCYPAMWQDPLHTPFNRFNRSSRVEISLAPSRSSQYNLWYYFNSVFSLDPLAVVGMAIALYLFLSRQKTDDKELVAGAGAMYILLLIVTSLVLRDYGNGSNAFLSARYVVPALPLLTVYSIEKTHALFKPKYFWLLFLASVAYAILRLHFTQLSQFLCWLSAFFAG